MSTTEITKIDSKTSTHKTKSKKIKKNIPYGRIYLYTTRNNTIITFTDERGNPHAWSSAGVVGFKGSRRSTQFAGQKAAEDLNTKIAKYGVKEVDVWISGIGIAKQMALRALAGSTYKILSLRDYTPIKFGGVKPRKRPRK